MNRRFILNLIELKLLKAGDEVLLDDPNKFSEVHNTAAPKGWVKVSTASINSDGYLPIVHPKGYVFEVFPQRVIDWRPAKERTDDANPEVR